MLTIYFYHHDSIQVTLISYYAWLCLYPGARYEQQLSFVWRLSHFPLVAYSWLDSHNETIIQYW